MLILLLLALAGCSDNRKTLSLLPSRNVTRDNNVYKPNSTHLNKIEEYKKTFGGSPLVSIKWSESVLSTNIPCLYKGNYIRSHKGYKWLRSPNILLAEYINFVCSDTLKIQETQRLPLAVTLHWIYFDNVDRKYYARASISNSIKTEVLSSSSNDPLALLKEIGDLACRLSLSWDN